MRCVRLKLSSLLALTFCLASASATWGETPPSAAQAEPKEKEKEKKDNKPGETGIEWSVQPGTVIVFLDKKKLGEAASLKFTKTTVGKHMVRLLNGEDETEIDVVVKKGESLKFNFTFDEP